LCVHDLTELKPVYEMSKTKLLQHTALAVDGEVLGLLHQHWFDDPKAKANETRTERRKRWSRSQTWPEAVDAVGAAPDGTRFISVADAEADDFQMFAACDAAGHGFVIRAQHDRRTEDGGYLREVMDKQRGLGCRTITVGGRSAVGDSAAPKRRRAKQKPRQAKLVVRAAQVTLAPPRNDPRYKQGRTVYAVSVQEVVIPAQAGIDPPTDVEEPIDWLLLTSEPVTCLEEALQIIEWCNFRGRRWAIEEFHKAQKTGCRLEASQLQSRDAFIRLASICAVIGVRLLHLRDAADDQDIAEQPASSIVDDPLWLLVVSDLAKHADPATLTVRQFFHAIARRGGWLGRKHDGRPGFQTLWRGWQQIAERVTGIRLYQQREKEAQNSV
jgi:hypothetical protein